MRGSLKHLERKSTLDKEEAIKAAMEQNPDLDPTHELDQTDILIEAEKVSGEEYELTDTTKIAMKRFKETTFSVTCKLQIMGENVRLALTVLNQVKQELEELAKGFKDE